MMAREGYKSVAVVDRNKDAKSIIPGCPIYHTLEELPPRGNEEIYFTIAIGGDRGRDRVQISERLMPLGYRPATLVHQAAWVEPSAEVGDGVQICAMATVSVEARIGAQSIINTNASVDHECVIGRGCHIMPGATVAGCVVMADFCTIGSELQPSFPCENRRRRGGRSGFGRSVGCGSKTQPLSALTRGHARFHLTDTEKSPTLRDSYQACCPSRGVTCTPAIRAQTR